jgi:hypothetical protein
MKSGMAFKSMYFIQKATPHEVVKEPIVRVDDVVHGGGLRDRLLQQTPLALDAFEQQVVLHLPHELVHLRYQHRQLSAQWSYFCNVVYQKQVRYDNFSYEGDAEQEKISG